MCWNSMVPMAWVLTDRGSLTQPERTNQSYLRRLSDQNNNRVIARARNSPGSSKERNDQVPGDGSLWWLNVTTLWMSTLYYFVWHISNKRRQNPSERQHKQNICSGFEPHAAFLGWAAAPTTAWSTGDHASGLSARPVGGGWGRGGDSGWLGWSSFDGHRSEEATRANLALVAPLIGPLFMQSSGSTYGKYWSCFDRVFSPLNNPPTPTQMPQQRCHTYQYSKSQSLGV